MRQHNGNSVWSLLLCLNWLKKLHYLTFFAAVLNGPHLKVVAMWAQKSSSVTTETNIDTLAICSLVFSRKFTYELHTKFLRSDKLFWTRMKKIMLLHYHPPLAILCCLYKKTVHLKPASAVLSPSLTLSLRTETEVWKYIFTFQGILDSQIFCQSGLLVSHCLVHKY